MTFNPTCVRISMHCTVHGYEAGNRLVDAGFVGFDLLFGTAGFDDCRSSR